MSTRHLLNSEGEVVCGASPKGDGSNVTSFRGGISCLDCAHSPCEVEIEFWDEGPDLTDREFFVKEAMQAAVGKWWYSLREEKQPLPSVTIEIDRARGRVVLKEVASS